MREAEIGKGSPPKGIVSVWSVCFMLHFLPLLSPKLKKERRINDSEEYWILSGESGGEE